MSFIDLKKYELLENFAQQKFEVMVAIQNLEFRGRIYSMKSGNEGLENYIGAHNELSHSIRKFQNFCSEKRPFLKAIFSTDEQYEMISKLPTIFDELHTVIDMHFMAIKQNNANKEELFEIPDYDKLSVSIHDCIDDIGLAPQK